jgi:hypothetical protein
MEPEIGSQKSENRKRKSEIGNRKSASYSVFRLPTTDSCLPAHPSISPAIKFKLLITMIASLSIPPFTNSSYAW